MNYTSFMIAVYAKGSNNLNPAVAPNIIGV